MNKKAIWAIIGLMSMAVIGLVVLQMDLIRTAVKENEQRFEKNIYSALNTVNQRLIEKEKQDVYDYYTNGFMAQYLQGAVSNDDGTANFFELSIKSGNPTALQPKLNQKSILDLLSQELENTCTCQQCTERKNNVFRQAAMMSNIIYQQNMQEIPLVERINLKHISTIIKQELGNRGIDTDFNYGVYSRDKHSFIIVDGHYMVEDAQPKEILPGYQTIYNSRYKVDLFPDDLSSPGMLMIHFPARTSFVWRSLWMNFLGAIIFTAIVMFCFAYTIHVIIQQKKLSEMKTDFINNMTHEFKTPIATISLAADSINSPMISGKPEKVQRFAQYNKTGK
jgi:two-component system phosphate regulon sensor histidine kinase PhoR